MLASNRADVGSTLLSIAGDFGVVTDSTRSGIIRYAEGFTVYHKSKCSQRVV